MKQQWDVFISHASEDTATVARPLADALRLMGLDVWLDGAELKLGDSLAEKVDEGLANSFYGVLIASPTFMAKRWAREELSGLMAKEELLGRHVILPVLHNVTKEQLIAFSPRLADRLASDTRSGINAVAGYITAVVLDPNNLTIPPERRGVGSRFVLLLNSGANGTALTRFLRTHRSLTCAAFGVMDWADTDLRWDVQLGPHRVDLAIGQYGATLDEWRWKLVDFLEPTTPLIDDQSPSRNVASSLAKFAELRTWVLRNQPDARATLPTARPDFLSSVIAGRRERLGSAEREMLQALARTNPRATVQTYDSLSERAVAPSGLPFREVDPAPGSGSPLDS